MVDWPVTFRMDLRPVMVERLCPHGVGHPDPDSLRWVTSQVFLLPENEVQHEELYNTLGIHSCDGCCQSRGDR
jgi:hypothetical protein